MMTIFNIATLHFGSGMMTPMRAARLVTALIVVGLVAGPVVLDACLISCHSEDEHRPISGTPACHHASPNPGAHVKAPVNPCPHDHGANPSTLAARDQDTRGSRDAHCDSGLHICVSSAFEGWTSAEPAPLILSTATARAGAPAPTPLRV
jgi:hypothetical protein